MKIDHIGCLVDNIEASLKAYVELGFSISEEIEVTSQEVKIAFVFVGRNMAIELIQPLNQESSLYSLRQKGATFYHIAFVADNYEKEKKSIEDTGIELMKEFKSEAFQGRRCVFFFNKDKQLIELIEEAKE